MTTASKKKTVKKTSAKTDEAVTVTAEKDAAGAQPDLMEEEVPLEKLVLDRKIGKYRVVEAISYWAKQLRQQEVHRHLTQNEILELAMRDILSGKVSEEEILIKVAALPAPKMREEEEEEGLSRGK